MKTTLAIAIVLLTTTTAYADTFGSVGNLFDIEFVTIGNPGNAADRGEFRVFSPAVWCD